MNNAHLELIWKNYPSDESPVNEENLNSMVRSINLTDENVHQLEEIKATKLEVAPLIADVEFDEKTGIFTFLRKDGSKYPARIWDTKLEQLVENLDFDEDTQRLIIIKADGTPIYVDVSAFVKPNEFLNSDTIAFSIEDGGKVKAIVREGSIQEKHMRPDYLTDIRIEQGKAQQSAEKSEEFAKLSESYTHGGTGVREGEDSDNAREYARQAKESAERAEEIISQGNTSEIITIEKSLIPTDEWIDTGIHKGDLKTGSYVVTLFANETEYGATRETYVGIMHWYSSITSSGHETNEILLHSSGYRQVPERRLFLRTAHKSNYGLILEIASSENPSLEKALDLVFTFKKIL